MPAAKTFGHEAATATTPPRDDRHEQEPNEAGSARSVPLSGLEIDVAAPSSTSSTASIDPAPHLATRQAMPPGLASYLARYLPAVVESVSWGEGFRFRVATYLTDDPPPLAYVTSVRAVVLRHGTVLVQRDRSSVHILPGGRRSPDEPPETTLRREIR